MHQVICCQIINGYSSGPFKVKWFGNREYSVFRNADLVSIAVESTAPTDWFIRDLIVNGKGALKNTRPGVIGGDFINLGIIDTGGTVYGGDHLQKAVGENLDQSSLVFSVGPVDGFQGGQRNQTDRVASGFSEYFTETGQLGCDDPASRGQPFEKH